MLLMHYILQTSKTDEILIHVIIYKVTADMSSNSRRTSSSGRSSSTVVGAAEGVYQ